MCKTRIALFAIVSIGLVLPTVASARSGFHGRSVTWSAGWRNDYRWHGPDWWGGGGYGSGYAPYYGNDGCYLVWQRFWNGYGWRLRSIQVCG
jgi:hypothetical protein